MMHIYNKNCFDVFEFIDQDSIDLVICDMPYGTTKNKWDSMLDLNLMWDSLKFICKERAPICLFAKQPFTSKLISANVKGYKHEWFWEKNRAGNFAVVKYQPLSIIEEILVFTTGGASPNYYPIKTKCKPRMNGGKSSSKNGQGFGGIKNGYFQTTEKNPTNLLKYKTVERRNSLHPSQKPVDLLSYIIKTYSKEGDLVLDFCMGSGSTGVAALSLKRKFIGIEIDEKYYNIAKSRLTDV